MLFIIHFIAYKNFSYLVSLITAAPSSPQIFVKIVNKFEVGSLIYIVSNLTGISTVENFNLEIVS